MAGDDWLFGSRTVVRKKKVVNEPDARIEKLAVPGRPIISDRSLQHVPDVVELMAGGLRLRRHPQRFVIVHVVGVQVTTRLLNGHDLANYLLRTGAKLGTIARLQHKANGLGPLVDVRVRIHGTLLRCVALAHKPAKVVHAPIGFEQIMHCGDALAGVDLTALPPESVLDRHRAYRDISELGVRRFVQIFNALVSPGGIVGQSDGRLWRTRACRRFSYLDRKSAPGRKR